MSELLTRGGMASSLHLPRTSPHYHPHRRFALPPQPHRQVRALSGAPGQVQALGCVSASPANAQGPFLSSWRQSRGTWVSIVIDVCGTSKGEAKARACGEGAVQDLGRV